MASYRFPKLMRLRKAADFERVFAAQVSAGDKLLIAYGAANGLGYPRLGLTVSRKIGKSTIRGLWKRTLREAFRLCQHELPDLDLVCIPRSQAEPKFRELTKSLP